VVALNSWGILFCTACGQPFTHEDKRENRSQGPKKTPVTFVRLIARSPRERELYDARLKMQRDEQSRIEAARNQSHAEGRLEGRIQLLQQLLGVPESTADEFERLTTDELVRLEQDLQQQLRARGVS
jgi:hypothetical protein